MRRLQDLVEIRSGYTFRSSIESFPAGNTEVIQAKDLGSDFTSALRSTVDFPGEAGHYLKPGDILVSARGFAKARLFTDKNSKSVASSSVFVLTPRSNDINAEFIVMFFNSNQGIRAMLELSTGASVKSITKESLGRIIIPELPPDKARALGSAVQAIDDELSFMSIKEIYLNQLRETIITKVLKEAK